MIAGSNIDQNAGDGEQVGSCLSRYPLLLIQWEMVLSRMAVIEVVASIMNLHHVGGVISVFAL